MNNTERVQYQAKDSRKKNKTKKVENNKNTTQPAKEWIMPTDLPP